MTGPPHVPPCTPNEGDHLGVRDATTVKCVGCGIVRRSEDVVPKAVADGRVSPRRDGRYDFNGSGLEGMASCAACRDKACL